MGGGSSDEPLPAAIQDAVAAAIEDGATMDEIVAWVRAGLILIETLRTLTLSALAHLSRREEPVSTEELARLALAIRRIEGTDKLRLERERAAAKAAAKAAPGAGQAPVRKGLSPEAVAAIREVVEGRPRPPERAVSSAPVDPWNVAESHLSQLIPLNPGESRSENVSGLSRPRIGAPVECYGLRADCGSAAAARIEDDAAGVVEGCVDAGRHDAGCVVLLDDQRAFSGFREVGASQKVGSRCRGRNALDTECKDRDRTRSRGAVSELARCSVFADEGCWS